MRQGSYHLGSLVHQHPVEVTIPVSMPDANYAVAVSNATAVNYWTWVRLSVVGVPRADGFTVRAYNDNGSVDVSDVWFRWVALWMR